MEQLVVSYLLPLIGSFFAFLALMLTRKILAWIQIKLNVTMDDKFQADLNAAVKDAIWAAEEMAASAAKQELPKITSGMKHQWVLNLVGKQFPMLTHDQAENKINAWLGKTAGLGATQCQGDSTTVTVTNTARSCEIQADSQLAKELSKSG